MVPARSTTEGSISRTRRRPSVGPDGGRPHLDHRRPRRDSYNRVEAGSRRPGRTSASQARGPAVGRFEQQHLGPTTGGLDQIEPGSSTRVSLTTTTSPGRSSDGEVGHGRVSDRRRSPVEARGHQQPGRTPWLDRRLGDERLGKPVVVGVHRDSGVGAGTDRSDPGPTMSSDMATMVADRIDG